MNIKEPIEKIKQNMRKESNLFIKPLNIICDLLEKMNIASFELLFYIENIKMLEENTGLIRLLCDRRIQSEANRARPAYRTGA